MTDQWTLEFYEDPQGREPVADWIRDLDDVKQPATLNALNVILREQGTDVCGTEWGKPLRQGLYEFRIRHDAREIAKRVTDPSLLQGLPEGEPGRVLLRIFFHAHGDRLILLLGAYDKGDDPSDKRQQSEIEVARKRLTAWKERQKRLQKEAMRGGAGKTKAKAKASRGRRR